VRARLRLAPPAAPLPDTRAAVARALLDLYAPVHQVLDNQAIGALGFDHDAAGKLDEIHSDPRYLIGRLLQALTALNEEVPPLDATAQLLGDAIRDAMQYRYDRAFGCRCGDECDRCRAEGRRALAYEGLWDQLGIIGELPAGPADLKAVPRRAPTHGSHKTARD
jgi:hypothetical protein